MFYVCQFIGEKSVISKTKINSLGVVAERGQHEREKCGQLLAAVFAFPLFSFPSLADFQSEQITSC